MKKSHAAFIAGNLLFNIMSAQTEVGAIAGGTFSYYSPEQADQPEHFLITGYSFGLISNITVVPGFVIQPAVHVLSKGGATSREIGTKHEYRTFTAFELPVSLLYHIESFSIGAGPCISINIAGKLHWTNYDLYSSEGTKRITIGNSNDDGLKPFDFGVNAMMSFETKIGLQFIVNYNHGFINLIPGDASRPNMQSHYFGIRVAYMFYRNWR